MFVRRNTVVLLLLAGLTAPALGQDTPIPLKWKFAKKGDTIYQTLETETTQSIQVMGSTIDQKQKQTFYYSWTLDSEPTAEDKVFKQKIEGVKMDINIAGNKIEYDSTKPDQATNTLSDFFKALIGHEFLVTIGKDNKVKKIEGKDKFIEKLKAANTTMEALLKQILSDDAMKEMAEPIFASLPDKDVKKGDKWERKSKLDMGPIGIYSNDYTYTLESVEPAKKEGDKVVSDGKATVKIEAKVTYNKPMDDKNAGLPFKIKDASIPPTTATGKLVFNTDKGIIESLDLDLKIKGELTIDIGGQSTKVTLDQTQKQTIKTSDTNPLKK